MVSFLGIVVFSGIIVENNPSTTDSLNPICFKKEKSV